MNLDDVISAKTRDVLVNMIDWVANVDYKDETSVKLRGRPKKDEHKNYKKPGTIIVGDVGVGKTFLLRKFVTLSGRSIIEFESNKMSRKNYELFVKQSTTYKDVTDLNKKKILLFDDIESMSDGDNLQVGDIIKSIKTMKIPFVGALHTRYVNKISEYKRFLNIISIEPPTPKEMEAHVAKIGVKFPRPFEGGDVRQFLIACDIGWSDNPDMFVHDSQRALVCLKEKRCVGYSINNMNIILHENYPYIDESCESIVNLATSDQFYDDSIENPFIDYLETIGNLGIIQSLKARSFNNLKPASLWTKMCNVQYKKKLMKEFVKKNNLDNTYDSITTHNARRLKF